MQRMHRARLVVVLLGLFVIDVLLRRRLHRRRDDGVLPRALHPGRRAGGRRILFVSLRLILLRPHIGARLQRMRRRLLLAPPNGSVWPIRRASSASGSLSPLRVPCRRENFGPDIDQPL